jgi:hypothetical protein
MTQITVDVSEVEDGPPCPLLTSSAQQPFQYVSRLLGSGKKLFDYF